jgi:hypothetical protein
VPGSPLAGALEIAPLRTVGIAAGNWCPSGAGASEDLDIEIASDQRVDRVPAGARLRVAISSSYWPMVMLSPEPVKLTVYTGTSRIALGA